MYQGIFDTDFNKYTEDAVTLFGITGLRTVFENLEGFRTDWQTNPAAFCSSSAIALMTSTGRVRPIWRPSHHGESCGSRLRSRDR